MFEHSDYLNAQITNTRPAGTRCHCAWLQFSHRDGASVWRLLRAPYVRCEESHGEPPE
jgi:hypothetical protein